MIESFNDIIEEISNKRISDEKLNEQISLANKILEKIPKNKKKELIKTSINSLINEIKNKNYKKSFGISRFIFLSNFTNQIEMIRKLGAFRSSKYNYQSKLIREIILDIYNKKNFNNEDELYLSNILTLSLLSPDISNLKCKIIQFIKSRPNFLKNALSLAEIKFSDIDRNNIPDNVSFQDGIYYYSPESIVSSISYTLELLKEIKPETFSHDSIYVESCSSDVIYMKIFYNAYLIQEFNEAEIKVDIFDYQVETDSIYKKILIHNNEFEMAMRQGYTKSDFRWDSIKKNILLNNKKENKYPLFVEFMGNLCSNNFAEENLYEIKKEPIERIVLKTLLYPFDEEHNFFSKNIPFLEEIVMLEALSLENYNNDFLDRKLYRNFTSLDIIKIQRFFSYISYIYQYAYKKLLNEGNKLADLIRKRSILPVMKTEQLAIIFQSICGHSVKDCIELINKISIDLSDKDHIVDLQYTPIVKMGDASLVAPTIFSQSNLIRALSLNENIHLSTFENIDHMISSVKNAFEKQKFYVKTDFEYGNDEVDIIAFLNGHLFIFECKNPYHPVNTYELRNTYNHLLKGFKQINKIKGILNEKNSLKQFLKNLKIEQNSIIDIHYGIINANRALYGLKKDDIKVLHANELINFLENGKFISMNKIYQSWENENFNVNDLIKFINGDIITSDFEKIKVDLFNEYKLRERSMIFITNTFDITQLKQHNDKKYKQKEMINLQ